MARARPFLGPFALAVACAGLAGCSEEFEPASFLEGPRILAVAPSPPEVGPGESVTLAPAVYAPAADPIVGAAWTSCPLSAGAGTGYACAVPSCETPLAPAPDGAVTAIPSALALACLESLGGALPSDPGGALPERIETLFRLRVDFASGDAREAVARVPLWLSAPPADRNLPPVLAGVRIGGVPIASGGTAAPLAAGAGVAVEVAVDPASVQTYVDASGRAVVEPVVISFFSSAGRFQDDRRDGPAGVSLLEAVELRPGDVEAEVWVVARDLRGGQAVAGPFGVPLVR